MVIIICVEVTLLIHCNLYVFKAFYCNWTHAVFLLLHIIIVFDIVLASFCFAMCIRFLASCIVQVCDLPTYSARNMSSMSISEQYLCEFVCAFTIAS